MKLIIVCKRYDVLIKYLCFRTVTRQVLFLKGALVDLWKLAFSYQVNPLAAVQPLATTTRGQ